MEVTAVGEQNRVEEGGAFLSLNRCLLVDSRFSSRKAFHRRIEQMNLFREVVDASSLSDASQRLDQSAFELCVVGPSVSGKRSLEFVRRYRSESTNKESALLVAKSAGLDDPGLEELRQLQADVCASMNNQAELADAIVVAVIKANPNSPWMEQAKSKRPGLLDRARGKAPSLSAGNETKGDYKGELNFSGFVETTLELLEQVFIRYREDISPCNEQGIVRNQTINDVRRVCEVVFRGYRQTPELIEFKQFFARTLLETLMRVRFISRPEATQEFRQKILSYQRSDKTN